MGRPFRAFGSVDEFAADVYGFPLYPLRGGGKHSVFRFAAGLAHVNILSWVSYTSAPLLLMAVFRFSSTDVRDALLEKARELGKDLQVDYVNVGLTMGEAIPPKGWVQRNPTTSTYRAGLSPDADSHAGSLQFR